MQALERTGRGRNISLSCEIVRLPGSESLADPDRTHLVCDGGIAIALEGLDTRESGQGFRQIPLPLRSVGLPNCGGLTDVACFFNLLPRNF